MQLESKCVHSTQTCMCYRNTNRKYRFYLIFIILAICFILKSTLFMLLSSEESMNELKRFEKHSGSMRIVAHKVRYDVIDGFYKNGTSLREHVGFFMEPWNVNTSVSRASLFLNKNIVERWSSIVLVKSSILNKNRRNLIRRTWAKFKFIDGVRLETVFILGTTDNLVLQAEILEENRKYGDLLQIDLSDTKQNVPFKTLAGMRWAGKNFPEDWIYSSADDDFILHPPNFIQYIENVKSKYSSQKLPIMCVYAYREAEKPNRDASSIWYLSDKEYPAEYYPPYCRGGWYSMPVKEAFKLYEISRTTPSLYLDDVWITGIMRAIMNNRESRMLPWGTSLSEEGITFAPLADRTNNQFYYNQLEDDMDKVIVSHTWSGKGWFTHSVYDDIQNTWTKWESSVLKKIKYVVTFSDLN